MLITSVIVEPGSSLLALLKLEKKIQSVRFAQPQESRKQMKVLDKHCQCWTYIHLDCIDSEKVNVWSLLLSNSNIVGLSTTQRTGKWVCPTVMTSLPGGTQLPNLRNLSIRNTNMSNQRHLLGLLLSVVPCCWKLRALAIPHIWDAEVVAITAVCSSIEHLNIDNVVFKDDGTLGIVQNCKGLKRLCIQKENYDLTDDTLVHIYTHCADTLHTLWAITMTRVLIIGSPL